MACPNSKKRKAAVQDDDGDDAAAVGPAAAPGQLEPAPTERRPISVMSQEWIDSVLADEIKPLPLNERLLKDPRVAAAFRSHEESRARFAEYQDWIRRQLDTKGYVEVDDNYDERCQLLQAVDTAAFYGRKDDDKEAMAKLAALGRA